MVPESSAKFRVSEVVQLEGLTAAEFNGTRGRVEAEPDPATGRCAIHSYAFNVVR